MAATLVFHLSFFSSYLSCRLQFHLFPFHSSSSHNFLRALSNLYLSIFMIYSSGFSLHFNFILDIWCVLKCWYKISDQVLLLVRLLEWKWSLSHPSLNNLIFIVQQMRWSIPFLIYNQKSGIFLHLKIVRLSLLIYAVASLFCPFLCEHIMQG